MNNNTSRKKKQAIRLADIAAMEDGFLTPSQVASVLRCTPYSINLMASDDQMRSRLGFPVFVLGTRVKIPRIPFLRAMGWEGPVEVEA